jgi:hypothetical protein
MGGGIRTCALSFEGLGPEQCDDVLVVTASDRQGIEDEKRQTDREPSDVEGSDDQDIQEFLDVARRLFLDFGLLFDLGLGDGFRLGHGLLDHFLDVGLGLDVIGLHGQCGQQEGGNRPQHR